MTQAPATTIATAVRQHGGGRHPLNLLCTPTAGRLQDSRGGVIDRRAKGATSSNTLPASCAAAAHPTTGVRRARELSPSLRSQSCQHAQLVEGYGQLDRILLQDLSCHIGITLVQSPDMLKPNVNGVSMPAQQVAPACINLHCPPALNPRRQRCNVSKNSMNLCSDLGRHSLLKYKHQNGRSSLKTTNVDGFHPQSHYLLDIIRKPLHGLPSRVDSALSEPRNPEYLYTTRLFCRLAVTAMVPFRYPYRSYNCPHRANCLKPSRRVFHPNSRHNDLHCPSKHTNRQKDPDAPNSGSHHAVGHFPFRHALSFQMARKHKILPALCHRVQRGAA